MLQTLGSFNRALLWTIAVGLTFVVLTQAGSRHHKHDLFSTTIREYLVTTPVLRALLLTGLIVAGLDFLLVPTILPHHAVPSSAGSDVVKAYALPDANVSVVEVQGLVSQRPAGGVGEWQIGNHSFSTDSDSTVHMETGQPVIACLVQVNGGSWRATAITDAAQPPRC